MPLRHYLSSLAALIVLALLATATACHNSGPAAGAPAGGDGTSPLLHILPRSSPPRHLQVFDIAGLPLHERLLITSLQGLVNRVEPCIYLIKGTNSRLFWLEHYGERYGVTWETAPDLWDLVDLFKGMARGAVVYDPALEDTINVATTLAGIEDLIIIHPDQIAEARGHGIEILWDLRDMWSDKIAAYQWARTELLDRCSHVAVGVINWDDEEPRDYIIAHRLFVFYCKALPGEVGFLWNTLSSLPDNIPVLGYLASSGVEEGLAEMVLSPANKFLIPSDNTPNLTVHSGIEVDGTTFRQPAAPMPELTDEEIGSKVFACFAFSDADNYSIPMGTMKRLWDDPARGEVPLAWGLPGTIPTLAPGIAAYYYDRATEKDRFIGMCGVGYAYPSFYQDRPAFTALSAMYMDYLDLRELWILDPTMMVSAAFLLDDFLVEMAGATTINGYMSNYFRSLAYSGYATDGTPYLYSVYSYPDDPLVDIPRVIDQAVALKRPGEPAFLFFGLNAWEVEPSEVAAALEAVARPEAVEAVSVPAIFEIMRRW